MWTELVIILAMLVAFGFAVPYIGDKHFQDTMPNFCTYDCYGNSSCNNQDLHWDCVYTKTECRVEWYFWCIV